MITVLEPIWKRWKQTNSMMIYDKTEWKLWCVQKYPHIVDWDSTDSKKWQLQWNDWAYYIWMRCVYHINLGSTADLITIPLLSNCNVQWTWAEVHAENTGENVANKRKQYCRLACQTDLLDVVHIPKPILQTIVNICDGHLLISTCYSPNQQDIVHMQLLSLSIFPTCVNNGNNIDLKETTPPTFIHDQFYSRFYQDKTISIVTLSPSFAKNYDGIGIWEFRTFIPANTLSTVSSGYKVPITFPLNIHQGDCLIFDLKYPVEFLMPTHLLHHLQLYTCSNCLEEAEETSSSDYDDLSYVTSDEEDYID